MAIDVQEFQGHTHFWYNQKSGEKTIEHPGKKYFLINRKIMRKRAEEKFQKDCLDKIEFEKIKYA
jgi:hypothetical protein